MRKAIIIGGSGQDGILLDQHLSEKEYSVISIGKTDIDITCQLQVEQLIKDVKPDQLYFLAAWHHSSEDEPENDAVLYHKSMDIHAKSVCYFLESIAIHSPATKLFYASSSHIYGDYGGVAQTENTIPDPQNIYAITKYSGMMACRYYRQHRGVFASCGILYNHESSYRPSGFISRKVALSAAEISLGIKDRLFLGSLDSQVDWGFAPDYVDAMHRILSLDIPHDYIVATGVLHSVRDMVDIAFGYVGLDYRKYIEVKDGVVRKRQITRLGDPSKLIRDTGWKPSISFEDMIKKMVDAEIENMRSSGRARL